MHLLPVTEISLDGAEAAVDLGQTPGDIVVLSFTDSDLSALAAAYGRDRDILPSLRLASLARLKHPMSVDLYVESVVSRARFVTVRCLGGLDYWRYGFERLSATCRERGIALVALSGDDRPDPRLKEISTVPPHLREQIASYWQAGGVDNLRQMLRRMAGTIGTAVEARDPVPLPQASAWDPELGPISLDEAVARLAPERAVALVLFYRSALLSGDTAPIEALVRALSEKSMQALPIAVSSLKDEAAVTLVREAICARRPDVIVTTTVFSAREDQTFVLDEAGVPVLQALTVGAPQAAWAASSGGLGAADLAMQIVLPEFDGRLVTRPISFKEEGPADAALEFASRVQTPDADGIVDVAALASAWSELARTPRKERRLALVLSDYPARGGRAGFAVGLDSPASVCRILDLLQDHRFDVAPLADSDRLIRSLVEDQPSFEVPLAAYTSWLGGLPDEARTALLQTWGLPESDLSFRAGAFRFRALRAGKVLIALQPDRAPGVERRAAFHDPDRPPCHAYLAFYLGLQTIERAHALIHLGTHGTTEWLPGKAVALSSSCWPTLATGAMPVIYPFIVNDPGEAAPAKRRLAAVTIGHLAPAVTEAGLHGEAAGLRELVEEFSAAQVLDPRRAKLVASDILDQAEASGLAVECGIDRDTPMEDALTRLDAHLCELEEVSIRDGLHIFGQDPSPEQREALVRQAATALGSGPEGHDVSERLDRCAASEREALVCALEGRFVPPGPAGSPARGHIDALPTGRNLATLDPRALPTRAAARLGEAAAAELVRRHLQDTGDWPRRIVMDLWASPTMRSGGEDLAHILALMGVRPRWDIASTRVNGFEIIPLPLLDRPRVDVTVRISGAFRDSFPAQLALLDQAARAVAALDEEDEWNVLAAARRRRGPLARVFGAAPGRYGTGVAAVALDSGWTTRDEFAAAYLANSSHTYGGPDGAGRADGSFGDRIQAADAFVHITDIPDRDILDGDDSGQAIGGFAAAAQAAGSDAILYSLDTTRAGIARVRTLEEDLARLIRGRLCNPRWIEGQLRHGFRGASELAQAADALFLFAATTDAVSSRQFDAVFEAFVGDESVFGRVEAANPAAAQAILDRFADARRRGLWISRSNSVAIRLDPIAGEAA